MCRKHLLTLFVNPISHLCPKFFPQFQIILGKLCNVQFYCMRCNYLYFNLPDLRLKSAHDLNKCSKRIMCVSSWENRFVRFLSWSTYIHMSHGCYYWQNMCNGVVGSSCLHLIQIYLLSGCRTYRHWRCTVTESGDRCLRTCPENVHVRRRGTFHHPTLLSLSFL